MTISNYQSWIIIVTIVIVGILICVANQFKKIKNIKYIALVPFLISIIFAVILSIVYNSWKIDKNITNDNRAFYESIQALSVVNFLFLNVFIIASVIYMFLHSIKSGYYLFLYKLIAKKEWYISLFKNTMLIIIFICFNGLFYLFNLTMFDSNLMYASQFQFFNDLIGESSLLAATHTIYNFFGNWYFSVGVLSLYLIGFFIGFTLYRLKSENIIKYIINLDKFIPQMITSLGWVTLFTMALEISLKSFFGLLWHFFVVGIIYSIVIVVLFIYMIIRHHKLGIKKTTKEYLRSYFVKEEKVKYMNYLVNKRLYSNAFNYKNTVASVIMIGFLAFSNNYLDGLIFKQWWVYVSIFVTLFIKSGFVYGLKTNTSVIKWSSVAGVVTIKPGAQTGAIGPIWTLAESLLFHIFCYNEYLTLRTKNNKNENP